MSDNVTNGPSDPFEKQSAERYREIAAEMFAAGEPVRAISAELGVTERSVRRWLKSATAQQVIGDIRHASMSSIVGARVEKLRKTMDRLDQLIQSEDERIALAAVRTDIEATMRLRGHEELDGRMRSIEEKLGIESPAEAGAT